MFLALLFYGYLIRVYGEIMGLFQGISGLY